MCRKGHNYEANYTHWFNDMRYEIRLSYHHTWCHLNCRGDSRSLPKFELLYQNLDEDQDNAL